MAIRRKGKYGEDCKVREAFLVRCDGKDCRSRFELLRNENFRSRVPDSGATLITIAAEDCVALKILKLAPLANVSAQAAFILHADLEQDAP